MNLPTIYCYRCQESVKPVKCIVMYRCPQCGVPINGYKEQPADEQAEPSEFDHSIEEIAVA